MHMRVLIHLVIALKWATCHGASSQCADEVALFESRRKVKRGDGSSWVSFKLPLLLLRLESAWPAGGALAALQHNRHFIRRVPSSDKQ